MIKILSLKQFHDHYQISVTIGFSISISMDDDSDGEADRRQAVMFKTHEVINPDEDRELLETRRHVRAVSLPPPMNNQVMSAEDITPVYVEKTKTESSLDRKPSYLRAVSPDPKVRIAYTVQNN